MLKRVTAKRTRVALGELESAIMAIVWKGGKATVREVVDVLAKKRDLAYTTVMTVMTRLCEKGILCREETAAGSFTYMPCLSREEFYAKTSRALFGELLRNFGSVAVAQFVDALEEVDPKQLMALREQLRARK